MEMDNMSRVLDNNSKISVVIPTYNRKEMLKSLLMSLSESSYLPREIIVIDDNSSDRTNEMISSEFPYVRYIRHNKIEFVGQSRNEGLKLAQCDYVFMVDDDNTVNFNCLFELLRVMDDDKSIGVAAPVTCYYSSPDIIMYAGSSYSHYLRRTIFLYSGHHYLDVKGQIFETDGFANSYMFRRKDALDAGPIPSRILLGGEDGYLQYKIKKYGKLKLICVGDARVFHRFEPGKYYSHMTPFKFYYAVRGKIVHEHDLDSTTGKLLFSIFLLGYLIFYLFQAFRSGKRYECIIAVLEGFVDGILARFPNRYY